MYFLGGVLKNTAVCVQSIGNVYTAKVDSVVRPTRSARYTCVRLALFTSSLGQQKVFGSEKPGENHGHGN